jgi:hypothetical protein
MCEVSLAIRFHEIGVGPHQQLRNLIPREKLDMAVRKKVVGAAVVTFHGDLVGKGKGCITLRRIGEVIVVHADQVGISLPKHHCFRWKRNRLRQ